MPHSKKELRGGRVMGRISRIRNDEKQEKMEAQQCYLHISARMLEQSLDFERIKKELLTLRQNHKTAKFKDVIIERTFTPYVYRITFVYNKGQAISHHYDAIHDITLMAMREEKTVSAEELFARMLYHVIEPQKKPR